jgi:hypothetical protein
MQDPRLHIAMLATDDRTRLFHKQAWAPNRGTKRFFRIGEGRSAAPDAGRR